MKYTMLLPDSVVKSTAALAEDSGSILSIYVVAPTVCNSEQGALTLASTSASHTQYTDICMGQNTLTHKVETSKS